MVDQSSTFSDGTCENFDFQVFESSFEGYQVASTSFRLQNSSSSCQNTSFMSFWSKSEEVDVT
jgi:hypothetical protein